MKAPIIAIDGPSGAGKGTVARRVAAALGYRHVDTSSSKGPRSASSSSRPRATTAVAEVATLITARDENDRTRSASPLYAAADAVIVDTTGLPVDDVVRRVLAVIAGRISS